MTNEKQVYRKVKELAGNLHISIHVSTVRIHVHTFMYDIVCVQTIP